MCDQNVAFLCFSFAVLRGGGVLKHTKISSTKTMQSIEKVHRGTLLGAFGRPLSALGRGCEEGVGGLSFRTLPAPFERPLAPLCAPFGVKHVKLHGLLVGMFWGRSFG